MLSEGSLCFADQKEIIYFHTLRWTWITKQQRKQCETNLVLHGLLDMMRTLMCYILVLRYLDEIFSEPPDGK